jgi:glycosyltransferase involved in cell wall biosynthesis
MPPSAQHVSAPNSHVSAPNSKVGLSGPIPAVSVIVPHFEDLQGLGLCLDALCRQTYPRDKFELIVADNSSPVGEDAVADVIAGRARLVVVPERGAGPARNGAVASATGEVLAFTDSDCQPEPEWLSAGVLALSRDDVVGGRVKVLVKDPQCMTPSEAFERIFAFDNRRYVKNKGFTVTANMFCPRAVFEKVGGFRVGVSEDVDWSRRARGLGFRLGYAAKAVVGHPARGDWFELKKKWRRIDAESYELIRGTHGGRLWWLLKSCALPLSAVAHSPRVLMSKELHSFSQRLSALAMLYRLRFWRFADALGLVISH